MTNASPHSFDVGALVRARGREWVVLPESQQAQGLLMLRPLGGTDDEITGVFLPLEPVEPATFSAPDPDASLGDHRSGRLLRDALRLGFRSGAGPFRALARIAVEPRPYQLVPLLMALKLDPVRLLIADDVGVGKTIEACLIARELLDRAEIDRFTVLCPPHLAEQWQRALRDQFHIDAALVLSSTAARLERLCRADESVFERFPFTIVSTDYIKQDRRLHEFIRTCPPLVIVDEAHTCAQGAQRSGNQRRHALLQAVVKDDPARHLILVTATPHSGDDAAFRSLLTLLDPAFADLPEDLSGDANRKHRERLARHLVQRRRGDLRQYLNTETTFPTRDASERNYPLSTSHRQLFNDIIDYCGQTVEAERDQRKRRIRWWAALTLLRALSSSPDAAIQTLRNRSGLSDLDTADQVDASAQPDLLDQNADAADASDHIPGADASDDPTERARLLAFCDRIQAFSDAKDPKLALALSTVQDLLKQGLSPILFCRFIPTARYVEKWLTKHLPKGTTVTCITGELHPEERERRIEALPDTGSVLVCTDCLSEGINLQHKFDAVVHYDLSWNPTRHEQREGRVDRFGQRSPTVQTITLYGAQNPVDGIVLEVLLRKHQTIRRTLGVTVPVPTDTTVVADALHEALLLRGLKASDKPTQQLLPFLDEEAFPPRRELARRWDSAVDREKRSRTLFAQNDLLRATNEEVAQELDAMRRALGSDLDVRAFTLDALRAFGVPLSADPKPPISLDLSETPRALRDALNLRDPLTALRVTFSDPVPAGAQRLNRTHPLVEGLAAFTLEAALDPRAADGPARRASVIRTAAVQRRTTLLLLRLRFHIQALDRAGALRPLLVEDLAFAAFTGTPDDPAWITDDASRWALFDAAPGANVAPSLARDTLRALVAPPALDALQPHLRALNAARAQAVLDAHRRVRKATGARLRHLSVDDSAPPDLLGVFVFLPVPNL